MSEKKYLIILVLKLLENESDVEHPMTQCEIARIISRVYPCDRKTVGRNIQSLIKIGYPIVKTSKGYYLDKKSFTLEEQDFIINAVKTCSGKTEDEKENIVARLYSIFSKINR